MNTLLYPLFGTLFTFLMTTLGSALVFFFKDEIKDFYQQLFLGFAAGIMIAASVWSLLIPSMEMAETNGQNSALILGGGFIIGALFLLFLDHVIPHQHLNEDKPEGPKSMLGKNTMLVLAVTLHNIPEGFAVGLNFCDCGKQFKYYSGFRICFGTRNWITKFTRRSSDFPSFKTRRNVTNKSFCLWKPFRNC